VAGAELIVLALGSRLKTGETAFLPQRVQAVVAAGEHLVRVALVADVPDELSRGVSNAVQSATVSSTTPSPAPMWPPVCDTTSISRWRTSSASCCSCSGSSA
jgi:hypothetical protein